MNRLSIALSAVLSAVLVPFGVALSMWLRWCWDVNRRRPVT